VLLDSARLADVVGLSPSVSGAVSSCLGAPRCEGRLGGSWLPWLGGGGRGCGVPTNFWWDRVTASPKFALVLLLAGSSARARVVTPSAEELQLSG